MSGECEFCGEHALDCIENPCEGKRSEEEYNKIFKTVPGRMGFKFNTTAKFAEYVRRIIDEPIRDDS